MLNMLFVYSMSYLTNTSLKKEDIYQKEKFIENTNRSSIVIKWLSYVIYTLCLIVISLIAFLLYGVSNSLYIKDLSYIYLSLKILFFLVPIIIILISVFRYCKVIVEELKPIFIKRVLLEYLVSTPYNEEIHKSFEQNVSNICQSICSISQKKDENSMNILLIGFGILLIIMGVMLIVFILACKMVPAIALVFQKELSDKHNIQVHITHSINHSFDTSFIQKIAHKIFIQVNKQLYTLEQLTLYNKNSPLIIIPDIIHHSIFAPEGSFHVSIKEIFITLWQLKKNTILFIGILFLSLLLLLLYNLLVPIKTLSEKSIEKLSEISSDYICNIQTNKRENFASKLLNEYDESSNQYTKSKFYNNRTTLINFIIIMLCLALPLFILFYCLHLYVGLFHV